MPGVWNFAFLRFSYIKQAAPNKAWTLRCSLGGTQTLNKSINNSQIPFERLLRHPSHSSRQHGTLKDAVRHQKAPTDTRKAIQCEQEPPRILEQPFGVPVTICWCRLVSVAELQNVQTVQTSRCYFFWPVLIFGKSTRKSANFWEKHAKNC